MALLYRVLHKNVSISNERVSTMAYALHGKNKRHVATVAVATARIAVVQIDPLYLPGGAKAHPV